MKGDPGAFAIGKPPITVHRELRRRHGIAMLRAGASEEEVAEKMGALPRTVHGWQLTARNGFVPETKPRVVPPKVKFRERSPRQMVDVPMGAW